MSSFYVLYLGIHPCSWVGHQDIWRQPSSLVWAPHCPMCHLTVATGVTAVLTSQFVLKETNLSTKWYLLFLHKVLDRVEDTKLGLRHRFLHTFVLCRLWGRRYHCFFNGEKKGNWKKLIKRVPSLEFFSSTTHYYDFKII